MTGTTILTRRPTTLLMPIRTPINATWHLYTLMLHVRNQLLKLHCTFSTSLEWVLLFKSSTNTILTTPDLLYCWISSQSTAGELRDTAFFEAEKLDNVVEVRLMIFRHTILISILHIHKPSVNSDPTLTTALYQYSTPEFKNKWGYDYATGKPSDFATGESDALYTQKTHLCHFQSKASVQDDKFIDAYIQIHIMGYVFRFNFEFHNISRWAGAWIFRPMVVRNLL